MKWYGVVPLAVAMVAAGSPAWADDFDFRGSFGPSGGFERYVPSISNPLFNETPYITTEARAEYMHQSIPNGFLSQGGSIDLGAVELRAALTDRLGFFANKDGYASISFNKGLKNASGFANMEAGLKYAVIVDPAQDLIVTVGAGYEPPSGDLITSGIRLQGAGSGIAHGFVSAAKSFGALGLEGSAGVNAALDGNHDSSFVSYALHADYEILPHFYPSVELNGWSVYDSGKRLPVDFEGTDLVNFGATGGGTVATAAVGARYEWNKHVTLGVAYERPITTREDLFGDRVTADLILRY